MGRFLGPLSSVKTYRYGIPYFRNVEDAWVSEALRIFDPHLHEDTLEFTKSGATVHEVQEIVREQAAQDRSWAPEFTNDELEDWKRLKFQAVYAFSCDGYKVQPYTLDEALDGMVLDTSAGYGFPGKKKEDVLPEIKKKAESILHDVKIGRKVDPLPCLLGTRGVLHHFTKKKRRVIYNVPASHVCIERMFATPITDKLKQFNEKSPMFFGKDLLFRLRRHLQKDFGYGSTALQGDIETFDRDVPVWLIHEAFDIVEELIDFEHWNGESISPAAQKRYKRWFEYVREYFVSTPVMLPDGTLLWMEGSVPSGSALTQLIGSVITWMIMNFTAVRLAMGVYETKVLGDDSLLNLSGRPDLERWAETILRQFHMKLSVKKTKVFGRRFGQKMFLGYDLRSGYLHRDRLELFSLLMHPEKPVDCIEKSFTRFIAYMFLGGVNDSRFCRFFEFYQSCYDIPDTDPQLTYDLETKRRYAGFNMPMKTLRSYTVVDFRRGLFGYKM